MNAYPGIPYRPYSAAFERSSDLQATSAPTVGLEFVGFDSSSRFTSSTRLYRSLGDHQMAPDLQEPRYGGQPYYSSPADYQQPPPLSPIGAAAGVAFNIYANSDFYTPYVAPYQPSSNELGENLYPRTESHVPAPYYATNTPVSNLQLCWSQLLTEISSGYLLLDRLSSGWESFTKFAVECRFMELLPTLTGSFKFSIPR
jgi:hypothetical protein